jgi:hypothetical protein
VDTSQNDINEEEDLSKKEVQVGYYLNYRKKENNGNTYN